MSFRKPFLIAWILIVVYINSPAVVFGAPATCQLSIVGSSGKESLQAELNCKGGTNTLESQLSVVAGDEVNFKYNDKAVASKQDTSSLVRIQSQDDLDLSISITGQIDLPNPFDHLLRIHCSQTLTLSSFELTDAKVTAVNGTQAIVLITGPVVTLASATLEKVTVVRDNAADVYDPSMEEFDDQDDRKPIVRTNNLFPLLQFSALNATNGAFADVTSNTSSCTIKSVAIKRAATLNQAQPFVHVHGYDTSVLKDIDVSHSRIESTQVTPYERGMLFVSRPANIDTPKHPGTADVSSITVRHVSVQRANVLNVREVGTVAIDGVLCEHVAGRSTQGICIHTFITEFPKNGKGWIQDSIKKKTILVSKITDQFRRHDDTAAKNEPDLIATLETYTAAATITNCTMRYVYVDIVTPFVSKDQSKSDKDEGEDLVKGAGILAEHFASFTARGTVFDGVKANGGGGGIFIHNIAATVIDECLFNNATYGDLGGALFYVNNVWANVTRSTFSNCGPIQETNQHKRRLGGAIAQHANFGRAFETRVEDCQFINNTATTESALAFESVPHLYVINSTFEGNVAGQEYGTVAAIDATMLRVHGSHFRDNTVHLGSGAAVHALRVAYVDVQHSTFENNVVTGSAENAKAVSPWLDDDLQYHTLHGGAIAVYGAHEAVRIHACDFVNNKAQLSGGALVFTTACYPSITHSTFTGNQAGDKGGAVQYVRGCPGSVCTSEMSDIPDTESAAVLKDIIEARVHRNNPFGDKRDAGHEEYLLLADGMSPLSEHNVFKDNSAKGAGGAVSIMYEQPTGDVTVSHVLNTTFIGNRAELGGGMICDNAGGVLFLDSVVARLNFANSTGGFLEYKSGWRENNALVIKQSLVEGNEAMSDGGGMHVQGGASVFLSGTIIVGNMALHAGGGIYCYFCEVLGTQMDTATSETLVTTGNRLPERLHGVKQSELRAWTDVAKGETNVTIIRDNIAFFHGGGVGCMDCSTLYLNGALVVGNSASSGGGVFAQRPSISGGLFMVVARSVVSDNIAQPLFGTYEYEEEEYYEDNGGGGGLWVTGSTLIIAEDSVVANNQAELGGGVLYKCADGNLMRNQITDQASLLTSETMLHSVQCPDFKNVDYKEYREKMQPDDNDKFNVFYVTLELRNYASENCSTSLTDLWSLRDYLLTLQDKRNEYPDISVGALSQRFDCQVYLPAGPLDAMFHNNTASLNAGHALYVSEEIMEAPGVVWLRQCPKARSRKANTCDLTSPDGLKALKPQPLLSLLPSFDAKQRDQVASAPRAMHLITAPGQKNSIMRSDKQSSTFLLPSQPPESGIPAHVQILDEFGEPSKLKTEVLVHIQSDQVQVDTLHSDSDGMVDLSALVLPGNPLESGQKLLTVLVEIPMYIGVEPLTFMVAVRDCEAGEERPLNGTDSLQLNGQQGAAKGAQVQCYHCPDSTQYNFKMQQCGTCNDHTHCVGGYGVPHDGYWHASYQSSHVTECVNRDACKYTGGAENQRPPLEVDSGPGRRLLAAESAGLEAQWANILELCGNSNRCAMLVWCMTQSSTALKQQKRLLTLINTMVTRKDGKCSVGPLKQFLPTMNASVTDNLQVSHYCSLFTGLAQGEQGRNGGHTCDNLKEYSGLMQPFTDFASIDKVLTGWSSGNVRSYQQMQCNTGYTGPLCGSCVLETQADGSWFGPRNPFMCQQCTSLGGTLGVVLGTIVVSSLLLLGASVVNALHNSYGVRGSYLTCDVSKILLLYIQQQSVILGDVDVNIPTSLRRVGQWFEVVYVPQRLECLVERSSRMHTSMQLLLLRAAVPIVIFLLVLVLWYMAKFMFSPLMERIRNRQQAKKPLPTLSMDTIPSAYNTDTSYAPSRDTGSTRNPLYHTPTISNAKHSSFYSSNSTQEIIYEHDNDEAPSTQHTDPQKAPVGPVAEGVSDNTRDDVVLPIPTDSLDAPNPPHDGSNGTKTPPMNPPIPSHQSTPSSEHQPVVTKAHAFTARPTNEIMPKNIEEREEPQAPSTNGGPPLAKPKHSEVSLLSSQGTVGDLSIASMADLFTTNPDRQQPKMVTETVDGPIVGRLDADNGLRFRDLAEQLGAANNSSKQQAPPPPRTTSQLAPTGSQISAAQVVMKHRYIFKVISITALMFFYPVLVSSVLAVFACKPVELARSQFDQIVYDKTRVWVMDTQTKCFAGSHLAFTLSFGVLGLLLLVLAPPCFLWYVMFVNRKRLNNPNTLAVYLFMYHSYKPKFYWWEALKMGYVGLLMTIKVFGQTISHQARVQLYLGMLCVYMFVLLTARPHRFRTIFVLDLLGGWLTLLTAYVISFSIIPDSVSKPVSPLFKALIMVALVLLVVYIVVLIVLLIRRLYLNYRRGVAIAVKVVTAVSTIMKESDMSTRISKLTGRSVGKKSSTRGD